MTTKTILISAITLATIFTSCKKKDSSTPAEDTPTTTGSTPANGFQKKTSPVTKTLNDVEFINNTNGYVVGNTGTVLKTTDGGETWTNVSVAGVTDNFLFCTVVDAQTAWATSPFGVYKTTNGGSTWAAVTNTVFAGNFQDIHFINTSTGFLVTGSGLVKTTDGGITWNTISVTSGVYNKIQFTNSTDGWVQSTASNVLRTTDGGATWTSLSTGVSNQSCSFFLNSSNAWVASAVSGPEVMRKTTDGGNSWSLVYSSSTTTDALYTISFTDALKGYRSRTLSIEKTADAGYTWTVVSTPLSSGEIVNDFYFAAANLGWAVGTNGVILKYTE